MNEKQYHKLDKIILNADELDMITQWVKTQNYKTVDIPLNECFIIINDIKNKKLGISFDSGIYFKINDNDLTIIQYDMKDFSKMFSASVGERFFTEQVMDIEIKDPIFKILGEEQLDKVAKASVVAILDVFQYMTHRRENVVKSKTRKTIHKQAKRTSRSKRSNYVKIQSNKYIFDTSISYTGNKYNRHAESWTVRGHWRYYKKSGKRVWIDGYTKGKGNVEGKVYKM